jgi:hypothetical protein
LSGSVHEYPGYDAHRHQFLKEQFACVRDVDLGESSLVVTVPAVELLLSQICNGHHATLVANMHTIWIAVEWRRTKGGVREENEGGE